LKKGTIKKIPVFTVSVAGVLALSLGFSDVSVGDKIRVVTLEEQEVR